jgi:sugar (pentulose or hexulose) kinase
MKEKFIVGIDGGTQSTKVVIFNTKGDIVCQGAEKLKPLYIPSFGMAEHPGDDLWDSLGVACKKALKEFPYSLDDIVGVGLCSIRCCGVVLKKDGSLANPVINWMDRRLSAKYDHKIKDVAYVTTTTGYLTFRMTGNKYDTAANLQGPWWPINKEKWQWFDEPEKFERFELPREMLFELKNPGDVVGKVTKETSEHTGLPEGLPVIATANDKAVEALGAGLRDTSIGLVSLGTFICTMIAGKEYRTDITYCWSNMACIPNAYIYEARGIRRGMSTVTWVKDLAGESLVEKAEKEGTTPEEILNKEAAKIPAGTYGLMTVPEWLGKPQDPFKRGIMIGFEERHSLPEMYRSVLEGIAMTLKNSMMAAVDELGVDLKQIIISGGGSNSDVFMQIFADVFGIETVRNVVNNAAGLGAAISVAVGMNVYSDFEEAMKNMVKIKDVFKPDIKNYKFYEEFNSSVYQSITEKTDEVLKKSYEILTKHDNLNRI